MELPAKLMADPYLRRDTAGKQDTTIFMTSLATRSNPTYMYHHHKMDNLNDFERGTSLQHVSKKKRKMLSNKPSSTGRGRSMVKFCSSIVVGIVGGSLLFADHTSFLSRRPRSLYHYARSLLCEDVTFKYSNLPYGTWTELYEVGVDYFSIEVVADTTPRDNEVAFIVPLLHCPDREAWELPGHPQETIDNELFYDETFMIKWQICEECGTVVIGDQEYNATAIAMFTPDSIECVGPDGELYDRAQVASDLGYDVKIYGPPLYSEDIQDAYLRENLESDAGIVDLIRLHAYNIMTNYPLAVLLEPYSQILRPINELVGTMLSTNTPAAFTFDYTPQDEIPGGRNRGVDMGLVALKPDEAVFEDMLNKYKTTTFDPNEGWDNSGIAGFPGALGCSGFLSFYYQHTDPSAKVLDKCLYMNGNEHHLSNIDGSCRNGQIDCSTRTIDGHGGPCQDKNIYPYADIYVAKLTESGCGKFSKCPSNENLPHDSLCNKFHNHWANERLDLETNFVHLFPKSDRNGQYKPERNLGYCKGNGKAGYNKMLKDGPAPAPAPPPATIIGKESCPNSCPEDQYLTQDCTCSSDECDACPDGTRCQKKDAANGIPAMCIDCECGFCNYSNESCCSVNARGNNCKADTNDRECLLQNGYFPGWGGSGDSCSGVEVSATATPNGCGCQPTWSSPCTFDTSGRSDDDKCFITRADELLDTKITEMAAASRTDAQESSIQCQTCMANLASCVNDEGQEDVHAMQSCIGKLKGKNGSAARAACSSVCQKL